MIPEDIVYEKKARSEVTANFYLALNGGIGSNELIRCVINFHSTFRRLFTFEEEIFSLHAWQ